MNTTNSNKSMQDRKKTVYITADLSMYGKIPPQARELESAVLGAIMMESRAFEETVSFLQRESFYVDAHQRIYAAMKSLSKKSQPIDILTTIEELKSLGELETVGGAFYVTKLTNGIGSAANIRTHAMIIMQKFLQREMIRVAGEILGQAYEDTTDVFDLIDIAESKISSLAIAKTIKPYETLQVVADRALQKVYETMHSKEELTGVPTGIARLDLITQGWQPTNLIILAARPAVGKSAVAANLALNAAMHPTKPTAVGVFTLEMPSLQWAMRMLSAESKIGMYELKRGRISDEDVEQLSNIVYKKLASVKIFFDDTSSLDIFQLKTKARMMVLKEKVGLIIVDYLQLMGGNRSNNENREQEISKISRELKQLAKELNIPIIALSQLSRKGEGGAPKLSDLRESGAIEQDADDVFFLVETPEDEVAKDASLKDSVIIKIAKHRNGIIENVPVKFVRSIQKIMSESEYEQYTRGSGKGSWTPVNIPKREPVQLRIEPGDEPPELPF